MQMDIYNLVLFLSTQHSGGILDTQSQKSLQWLNLDFDLIPKLALLLSGCHLFLGKKFLFDKRKFMSVYIMLFLKHHGYFHKDFE
jgi:hypothetical protein